MSAGVRSGEGVDADEDTGPDTDLGGEAMAGSPEEREEEALRRAQDCLGTRFQSKDLLRLALTHRSYANEQGRGDYNERLEFLGDAVIGLLVTEELYRLHTELEEGGLTQLKSVLVSRKVQASVAQELGLDACILLGMSEEKTGGRERTSTLANVFEAVVGAMYLERGLETARALLRRTVLSEVATIQSPEEFKDPKTRLQELIQKSRNDQPSYHVVRTAGPDHSPTFTVTVAIRGVELGRGTGGNKKQAESAAAVAALKRLRKTELTAILASGDRDDALPDARVDGPPG